ncbi:MAG: adenosylhomocysteinase [Christensenellaceae bacterium]|jgi:adenosylhomocysteinase|nr:adenosylhomocysteinase [Christensenellaceae bacterium]
MSTIRDASLAPLGQKRIDWVKDFMPVLGGIERAFAREQPLHGLRIALSIHLEAKTAYLALVLQGGGAQVCATGSNPLSTKDDICAALAAQGVEVHAWFGATQEEYSEHIRRTLEFCPHIIIDDGGDLVAMLIGSHPQYAKDLIGGCEETTTGVHRLRGLHRAGKLPFPMIAVNDASSKRLFDNHHGTGQSVWDAILSATNNMVSGRTVVVAGYGHCGSGIAKRGQGLGAQVIITEVDPHRALTAAMDGFRVLRMEEAAPLGDIFITATGCKDVITRRHFEAMRHNAILANAGHFDVEINKNELRALCSRVETRKPFIEGYRLRDGRVLNVLADGRLVNVVAGNGHPADIMDMSFALQALCARYLARQPLEPGLYEVPPAIDREVALLKAAALGLGLDALTPAQQAYLEGDI